jgi:hypothetical protein
LLQKRQANLGAAKNSSYDDEMDISKGNAAHTSPTAIQAVTLEEKPANTIKISKDKVLIIVEDEQD